MAKAVKVALHPITLTIVGLTLLMLVVFFGGRALAEREVIEVTDGTLIMLCLLIVAVAFLVFFWRRYQALKNSEDLESKIRQQALEQVETVRPDRQPEIRALQAQFDDALGALKKSRLGKGALYALPWHIIIGPPGSGKTTILRESGLNFPYSSQEGRGIRGIGGTRNCDWWFTDQGILLDTAGRYTTEAEDHDEWLSFLQMLARARKRKPINGVLVAISIEDLLAASEEDVADHAEKVRERIHELTKELELVFPVYLVFTKCDLLDGFVATFGGMNRDQRGQVWGCTLTPEVLGERAVHEAFDDELGVLYDRLCSHRLSLLSVPRPAAQQARIYSFPLQLSVARSRLKEFVRLLAQPNPYHEGATLRGFYFTSGTQEGTPIDRVLAAMGEAFGMPGQSSAEATEHVQAKSYFIDSLFTDVVFVDSNLARSSAKVARRRELIRKTAVVASFAATVLLTLLLVIGYFQNRSLINDSELIATNAITTLLAPRYELVKTATNAGQPLGDFKPSEQERQAMMQLADHFAWLHENRAWGGLLGRYYDLHREVRRIYIRALHTFFLRPTHAYLGESIDRQIKSKPIEDHEKFAAYLSVYEALSKKRNVDLKWLNTTMDDLALWSWNPTELGTIIPGRTDRPHHLVHLDRFTDQVMRGLDWDLDSNDRLCGLARDELKAPSRIEKIVEDVVTAEGSVNSKELKELKLPDAASIQPLPRALVIPAALQIVRQELENELRRASGGDGTKPLTPEDTKLIEKKLADTQRDVVFSYISNMEAVNGFQDLNKVVDDLDAYIGEKGTYPLMIPWLQGKLRDGGVLENGTGEVPSFDFGWLAKAMKNFSDLKDKIEKFNEPGLGSRILPDVVEGGVRIKELLNGFTSARTGINRAVQKAHPDLSGHIEEGVVNLLRNIEDALRNEIREEARAHWDKAVGRNLAIYRLKFPFKPDTGGQVTKEEVTMEGFVRMFNPVDGSFENALAPLEKLSVETVHERALVQFDDDFAYNMRLVREEIHRAMFPDSSKTAQVVFTVAMRNQPLITDTQLHLSPETVIKLDDYGTLSELKLAQWTWTQNDRGADVRVQTSESPPQVLGLSNLGLPDVEVVRGSQWSLLRLIQASSPAAKLDGKTVRCEWTFTYARRGLTPQTRKAIIDIETVRDINPFHLGFLARLRHAPSVFK